MSFPDEFSIKFSGLKTGMHQFSFEISDAFFEKFENSEIRSGKVNVELQLDKKEKMISLFFTLKGHVILECDRCLDEYSQPIFSSPHLVLKMGKFRREESDEIEVVPETAHEINVAQYIYEYIFLALPAKKIHPDNEKGEPQCNKNILKKLKEHDSEKKQKNNNTDPRWDALKNLKFN